MPTSIIMDPQLRIRVHLSQSLRCFHNVEWTLHTSTYPYYCKTFSRLLELKHMSLMRPFYISRISFGFLLVSFSIAELTLIEAELVRTPLIRCSVYLSTGLCRLREESAGFVAVVSKLVSSVTSFLFSFPLLVVSNMVQPFRNPPDPVSTPTLLIHRVAY